MHIPDTGHTAEVQGGRDSEVEKMGPDVDRGGGDSQTSLWSRVQSVLDSTG